MVQLGERVAATVARATETDTASWEAVRRQLHELIELIERSSHIPVERLTQMRSSTDELAHLLDEPPNDRAAGSHTWKEATREAARRLQGALHDDDSRATDAALPTEAPEPEFPIRPENHALLHDFLVEARGHIESAEAAALSLRSDHPDPEIVAALFRSFHSIKGVASLFDLKQIGALTHAAEAALEPVRDGGSRPAAAMGDLLLDVIDRVKHLLSALEASLASGDPIPTDPALPSLLQRLRIAGLGAAARPAARDASRRAEAPGGGPPEARGGAPLAVKIATDRLDRLVDAIGELVIAQSMVSRDVAAAAATDPRLAMNFMHLGKITRELQDLAAAMRMVPIRSVFQRMARVARDLSRKFDKEIDFSIKGGETELDRNLVESLIDPLAHMIRNALDHGIEPRDERLAAGKPPRGRVEIEASHVAGNVVIRVWDDGRGLDARRILQKATESGLVQAGEQMSEAQIYRLTLRAGLSTAPAVTDVSGRGVGMDVVRKNVESLRGRIEIESTPGRGAAFTLWLPLTLAVIDGLIVRVGRQRYILPCACVSESVAPSAERVFTLQGRGEVCLVRDEIVPLFRLRDLFGVGAEDGETARPVAVIVHDNQRRGALLIDELLGQQQVVIKPLDHGVGEVPGVSGGAVIGDGAISLIIDVPSLLDLAAARKTERSHAYEGAGA